MILTVTPNAALDRMIAVKRLNIGEPTRPYRVLTHPGGGGVHASRVIRQLGGETVATGFLGGATGEIVEALMTREGLPSDFVAIAGETRCNVCIIEDERGALIELPEVGPTVSAREVEALAEKVSQLIQKADLLLLSGSLPPGCPADFFARLAVLARIPVLVDTSGAALTAALTARPWLVKPNLVEFEELTGIRGSSEEKQVRAAKELVEEGIGAVALTRGRQPLLLVTREGAWRITPPAVTAYNPIGAGDTFTGAVALKYLQTADIVSAVAYGAVCAAVNCRHLEAGWAPPDEVEALLHLVTIERLY